MVQVSVILKVPLFFSFGDKSRLFMTEDCNSNNTLLTPGVTTKQLHYKHDNKEKFNQKDIIIQFTVACFTTGSPSSL